MRHITEHQVAPSDRFAVFHFILIHVEKIERHRKIGLGFFDPTQDQIFNIQ